MVSLVLCDIDYFLYYLSSRVYNIRRGRVSNAQYILYKHTATSLPFGVINSSPGIQRHSVIGV